MGLLHKNTTQMGNLVEECPYAHKLLWISHFMGRKVDKKDNFLLQI